MNTNGWEVIKDFYEKKFGIDGWVVEMYANLDILSLCVAGASAETICKFLELSIPEVTQILYEVFEFEGWDKDLPLNPYRIYCLYNGERGSVEHFLSFTSEISTQFSVQSGFENIRAEQLFYMCKTYSDIEERIQNEWI
jgi:hypothetical protein